MVWKLASVVVMVLGVCANVQAQSVVIGNSTAQICYMSVKFGDPGRATTIKSCKKALKDIHLSHKDKAATHVNIGILYMRSGDNEQAQKAFSAATTLRPNLAESYINYAASLIYTGDYDGALKAANTSIELGSNKMAEALFNRAIIYDYLRRDDDAYADFKQALVLRPNWQRARRALDKYDVTPVQNN